MRDITREEMSVLVRLQKSETEIVRIESVLEKIEQEKAELEKDLAASEKMLQGHEDELKKTSAGCRDLEAEIQVINDRMVKSRENLRHVRTNKEYQSLQREIDDNIKRKEGLENSYFEMLEKKEAREVLVKEKKAEFEQLKENIRSGQEKIEKNGEQDRNLLEKYRAQREKIGKRLDPGLFQKFLEISETGEGRAVVEVRDEVCRGCFMNVPPQLYIEVQKGKTLILCPQCNRILYYDESSDDTAGPD
ncbi:MAG: C4-type zinc ribbon domain-containing protein [Desulfobacteraceae bacterium]